MLRNKLLTNPTHNHKLTTQTFFSLPSGPVQRHHRPSSRGEEEPGRGSSPVQRVQTGHVQVRLADERDPSDGPRRETSPLPSALPGHQTNRRSRHPPLADIRLPGQRQYPSLVQPHAPAGQPASRRLAPSCRPANQLLSCLEKPLLGAT